MFHVAHAISMQHVKREPRDINWLVWHGILLINWTIDWQRETFETKGKPKNLIVKIENLRNKLKSHDNQTKFDFSLFKD
jgi:hypothetical protein